MIRFPGCVRHAYPLSGGSRQAPAKHPVGCRI